MWVTEPKQKENIVNFSDLDFELPSGGWIKSTKGVLINVQNICTIFVLNEGLSSESKRKYRIMCSMTDGDTNYTLAEIEVEPPKEEDFSSLLRDVFKPPLG